MPLRSGAIGRMIGTGGLTQAQFEAAVADIDSAAVNPVADALAAVSPPLLTIVPVPDVLTYDGLALTYDGLMLTYSGA